jgi:hypothetical protein
MIKYFKLLIELSWIHDNKKDSYINTAQLIENNQNKNLLTYHKDRYFFYYYNKLLNLEITNEEFTKIGDISNELQIYKNQNILNSISQINKLTNIELKNTIIIIDSCAKQISDWKDEQTYHLLVEKIKKLNSILVIL